MLSYYRIDLQHNEILKQVQNDIKIKFMHPNRQWN